MSVCLFAAAALVVFLRSHVVFLHPFSGWEDATQGIDFYAPRRSPVFHRYAGYVSALPNLVDWLSLRLLPLRAVPYAQAWFALCMAALVPAALYRFFRGVYRSGVGASAGLALAVGTAPLADLSLVSNTEFSIWPMLAVVLLTLFDAVPNGLAVVAFVCWRAAFVTSNPVALAALPVWAALAVIRRDRVARSAYLALIVIQCLYGVVAIDHAAGAWRWPALPGIVAAGLRLGVEKSLADIVLRFVLHVNGVHLPLWLCAGAMIAVCAAVVWVHGRGKQPGRAAAEALLLPVLALAVALLCAIGRGVQDGAALLIAAPRYHAVPALLWLGVLATLALDLWRLAGRARPRLRLACTLAAVAALALVWSKGVKAYRWQDTVQSYAVENFLARADAALARGQTGPFDLPRRDTQGDWSLHIER